MNQNQFYSFFDQKILLSGKFFGQNSFLHLKKKCELIKAFKNWQYLFSSIFMTCIILRQSIHVSNKLSQCFFLGGLLQTFSKTRSLPSGWHLLTCKRKLRGGEGVTHCMHSFCYFFRGIDVREELGGGGVKRVRILFSIPLC